MIIIGQFSLSGLLIKPNFRVRFPHRHNTTVTLETDPFIQITFYLKLTEISYKRSTEVYSKTILKFENVTVQGYWIKRSRLSNSIKRASLPPYMTSPLLLKITWHWSSDGQVSSKWKERRSHCFGSQRTTSKPQIYNSVTCQTCTWEPNYHHM